MIEKTRTNLLIQLKKLSTDYQELNEEELICKGKMRQTTSSNVKQELEKLIQSIRQEKLRILDEMLKINMKLDGEKMVTSSIEQEAFTPSSKSK